MAAMLTPRAGQAYRPIDYWASAHDLVDLRAVGHPMLPLTFNRHLYANAADGVLRALAKSGVDIRNRTVLDVGSGTGFWVDLWRRQGAARVAGADLVPAAVERLAERFRDVSFVAADVSEHPPYPGETFDVVSIMSVLHHIVDEMRFRTALGNLASQLASGGRLIVLDPLVRRGRWMPSAAESAHNVVRTTSEWESAAASAGLRIEAVVPTSAFLSDPVDAGSRAVFEAHRLWWRSITAALRGRERLAGVVLPPLAALDRAATRRSRFGVSAKLIVLAAG